MDIIERLEAFLKVLADNSGGDVLQAALRDAIAEIKRLRALAGVVSDLPAEDQARLDKAYGTTDRQR